MKKLLLVSLLLVGCAALKNAPAPKPVDVLTPVVVEEPKPEVPQSVEPVKPTQPVVTPIEVPVLVGNPTRYVLEAPQSYAKYIPRAEKFFQLALTDASVINKSKFDFSDATADSLKETIRKGFTVRLRTYQPSIWKGGKWSKVIGYHSAGTIYLNTYYMNRDDCSILNTLVHEASHTMGYSHGNNSPDGKDNSLPYWIGDRAEELCKEGKI